MKLKIKDIVTANIITSALCSNCHTVIIEGVLKPDDTIDHYVLHIDEKIDGFIPTGTLTLTDSKKTYDVANYAQAKILDINLVPSNIKRGVTILGVTGTLDTSIPDEPIEPDEPTEPDETVTTTVHLKDSNGNLIGTYETKNPVPHIMCLNSNNRVYLGNNNDVMFVIHKT